jgi:hypothetical protein
LEFYTVACKEIFKNYLKYWGSIVGGVLLSLEFYTVAIPFIKKKKKKKKYAAYQGRHYIFFLVRKGIGCNRYEPAPVGSKPYVTRQSFSTGTKCIVLFKIQYVGYEISGVQSERIFTFVDCFLFFCLLSDPSAGSPFPHKIKLIACGFVVPR